MKKTTEEKIENRKIGREIRSIEKKTRITEERVMRCPTCLSVFRIVHDLPATGLAYTCPVCQQSSVATERNSVQVKVSEHEE